MEGSTAIESRIVIPEEFVEDNPQFRCRYVHTTVRGRTIQCDRMVTKEGEIFCNTCLRKIRNQAMMRRDREEKERMLVRRIEERNLLAWAKKYRVIKGEKFKTKKYPFLNFLYEQMTYVPRITIKKGVQCGVSEWGINRSIFLAGKKGMRILYLLPDEAECGVFSDLRLTPAVSDYIEEIPAGKNSVNNKLIKRIHNGYVMLRGTRNVKVSKDLSSSKKAIMIDADMIIYDEKDFGDQEIMARYLTRIEGSEYRWIMNISTPTYPGFGIDKDFEDSSQYMYFHKCGCGEWNNLSMGYPELWDEDNARWRCKKCFREIKIDDEFEWVESFPERDHKGFLISAPMKLDGKNFKETKNNKFLWRGNKDRFLFNSLLGLAFEDGHYGVTEEMIQNAMDSRVKRQIAGEDCFLGVDIGVEVHAIIVRRTDEGKIGCVWWGKFALENIENQIDIIMRQFKIKTAVFDLQPQTHTVRQIQNRFHRGKIWLAFYINDAKRPIIEFKDEEGIVYINKVESTDKMVRMIGEKEILFPSSVDSEFENVKRHLKALIRKEGQDRFGNRRAEWIPNGDDHYSQALIYAIAATQYRHTEILSFKTIDERLKELETQKN